MKKILILFIVATLSLNCSSDNEKQNLDINVSGRVTNESNVGVGNVTIYIQRGKIGNYTATVYEQYETVLTNSSGNYSYLVKNETFQYKICCGIPTGYSIVGQSCTDVNQSIVNNQTVPNNINFKLSQ
ncbi:carboxypeptidase-like regulatory domain-containing protein [Flavobacterium sp. I-SCBP12n]|uniref:Carboxypeptidase-like regulatory domain-containing protein n=1 Tax=Flavobacterium pygoscelis TaxID=2893176 RepID=A0A9X2BN11_9FLAO|nr:carboxypeptidase-like regulatory domain-containing protein [Flavobacterium pygoscelis]MCK8143438.1 carboxypeptidase-like regulatory domain-containing protein [Flavobacterium pygoscelis]